MPATGGPQTPPPYLRKQGTATQLVVGGKPFLILGGELGNSSSSSIEYLRPIWPKLVALNLNTVVIPNGDQTNQGRHLRFAPGRFGIQRVKLYRYR